MVLIWTSTYRLNDQGDVAGHFYPVFRIFWLPEIIILVALDAVLTYLLIKGRIAWLKAVVLLIVGDIVYLFVANISVAAIVFGILKD